MFFENEPTRTLTLIEFLLVMLIGLAPVALTIWMKQGLYRRRVAEDERDSPARADNQSHDATGSAGVFSDDTVTPFFQVRESRIVRKLPATFDRNKPLGLFVVNPAAEDLKFQNGKEEKQSPAICGNTVGTSEGGLTAVAAGVRPRLRSIGFSKGYAGRRSPSWTLGLESRDAHWPKPALVASSPTSNIKTRKVKARHEEPKYHHERC